MLAYCLLALLALGVTADHHDHGDHPRLTCDDITPLAEVNYADLSGKWVAVKSVIFKYGLPYTPMFDKRPKTCMFLKNIDISDAGMTFKIYFNYAGKELVNETATVTKVGETEKGRLAFSSDLSDYENREFLIMDTEPTKYMVYALCQPPNEAGERLPVIVVFLSRHTDHKVITDDEKLQIEKKIGEILKLEGSGVKPVKYSQDCWASYAEPQ